MALYILTNVFLSTTIVAIIHAYIEYSDSYSFQVLVSILSVVDDTKLVSKVWFLYLWLCSSLLEEMPPSDSFFHHLQIIIRDLEKNLKELILDQVDELYYYIISSLLRLILIFFFRDR